MRLTYLLVLLFLAAESTAFCLADELPPDGVLVPEDLELAEPAVPFTAILSLVFVVLDCAKKKNCIKKMATLRISSDFRDKVVKTADTTLQTSQHLVLS